MRNGSGANVIDFVTLTCPSCGGELQVTNDIDRFACAYCGVEHFVRRGGGIVSLSPVLDRLAKVETEVNKTASDLAIMKLTEEIEELQVEISKATPGSMIVTYIILGVVALIGGIYLILVEGEWGWALCSCGFMAFLILTMRLLEFGGKEKAKALEEQLDQKQAELARLRGS